MDVTRDWGEHDQRWRGIRTEWVTVRGRPVRTLRHDGPGTGTPQVLVHGLGGSATNWLDVIVGLARRGPVIAPDLPGFGETEPPQPSAATVPEHARFVPTLCRELGWERIALHGNSMGGLIAVLVAADHPELVERLVLAAPGLPAPWRDAHRTSRTALATFAVFAVPGLGRLAMRGRAARMSADEVFEEMERLVLSPGTSFRPALREVGVRAARRGRELPWRQTSFVAAAESVVSLLVPGRRVRRAVDTAQAPTLLIWGEEDRLVGRHVIEGLAERRPDWDVEVFDGCGHAPMLEMPDHYLDVVTAWLEAADVGVAA